MRLLVIILSFLGWEHVSAGRQSLDIAGYDFPFPEEVTLRKVTVGAGCVCLTFFKGEERHCYLEVYTKINPSPGVLYKEEKSWSLEDAKITLGSVFLDDVKRGSILLRIHKKDQDDYTAVFSVYSERALTEWVGLIERRLK